MHVCFYHFQRILPQKNHWLFAAGRIAWEKHFTISKITVADNSCYCKLEIVCFSFKESIISDC